MTKRIKDAAKKWPPTLWRTNDPYAMGLEPDATAIIVSATKIDGYVHLTVVQKNRQFFSDLMPVHPGDLDPMVTALHNAVGFELGQAGLIEI